MSKHTSGPWVITCYRDRRFCGLPWLVVARAENTVTKEIIRPTSGAARNYATAREADRAVAQCYRELKAAIAKEVAL